MLLAALRAQRSPRPSPKARTPSVTTMCRAVRTMLDDTAWGCFSPAICKSSVGVVCMRVFRMSNGCVNTVASVPAYSELALTTHQAPVRSWEKKAHACFPCSYRARYRPAYGASRSAVAEKPRKKPRTPPSAYRLCSEPRSEGYAFFV